MKNSASRLLTLVLVLVMLFSLVACGDGAQGSTGAATTAPATTSATTPTETTPSATPSATPPATPPTTPESTVPPVTIPIETVYPDLTNTSLVGNPELFVVDFIEDDYTAYNETLDQLDAMIAAGNAEEAFIELYIEFVEDGMDRLQTNITAANVLYSLDLNDAKLSNRYLELNEFYTECAARIYKMYQTVYDSPYRDTFYEGWSEEEIAKALQYAISYGEEYVALNKENEELLVKYRAMTPSLNSSYLSESAKIYEQLVKNNNAIAALFNYDNFLDYAYAEMYSRDYTPNDTETFRTYVKNYVADFFIDSTTALDAAKKEIGIVASMKMSGFLSDNFQRLDYGMRSIQQYLNTVSEYIPDFGDVYDELWASGRYVLATGSETLDAAFTTYLATKQTPIVYFGSSYKNVMTLMHEYGHYYAFEKMGMVAFGQSYDLMESQSQGNEWLFLSLFPEYENGALWNQYGEALILQNLNDTLSTIVVASMVDAFEKEIYSNPDLTYADYDQVYNDLCREYGVYDALKSMLGYEPSVYWHLVALDNPGYYISYAMSAVPAVSVYVKAENESFEAAAEAYRALLDYVPENADEDAEYTFVDVLTNAGFSSPFEEVTYTEMGRAFEALLYPAKDEAS